MDDAEKQALYRIAEDLIGEQNIVNGAVAGMVAAAAGALAWGVFVMQTGSMYGLIAIGLGLFVGWGVRVFGRGIDTRLPIIAAVLAVVGCVLGNVAAILMITLRMSSVPLSRLFDIVSFDDVVQMTMETLGVMDLVFWLFAAGAAAQIAKRRLSNEEQRAISLHEIRPPQQGPISPG